MKTKERKVTLDRLEVIQVLQSFHPSSPSTPSYGEPRSRTKEWRKVLLLWWFYSVARLRAHLGIARVATSIATPEEQEMKYVGQQDVEEGRSFLTSILLYTVLMLDYRLPDVILHAELFINSGDSAAASKFQFSGISPMNEVRSRWSIRSEERIELFFKKKIKQNNKMKNWKWNLRI